jgi:SAM-dependent methyltransferase
MPSHPIRDPELALAEELELRAAADRVDYFQNQLARYRVSASLRILDVGCGNGYSVTGWRRSGALAIGIDNSTYRLERWLLEYQAPRPPLLIADATRLPFRSRTFDAVVSSGLIEHVGVQESRPPYLVHPLSDRDSLRSQVLHDMLRVATWNGVLFLDFPNGSFPIDFWHGDSVGAFRVHNTPDALLPRYTDIKLWVHPVASLRLLPLTGRLRFRQVSHRWWGRALRRPMSVFIRILDGLRRILPADLVAPFYPFLVISLQPRDTHRDDHE